MKRARDIRDQVLGLMERVEVAVISDRSNEENIKKAIASGFFYHTAKLARSGADYRTVKNPQTVHVHPQSGLIEVRTSSSPVPSLTNICKIIQHKSDSINRRSLT